MTVREKQIEDLATYDENEYLDEDGEWVDGVGDLTELKFETDMRDEENTFEHDFEVELDAVEVEEDEVDLSFLTDEELEVLNTVLEDE